MSEWIGWILLIVGVPLWVFAIIHDEYILIEWLGLPWEKEN